MSSEERVVGFVVTYQGQFRSILQNIIGVLCWFVFASDGSHRGRGTNENTVVTKDRAKRRRIEKDTS